VPDYQQNVTIAVRCSLLAARCSLFAVRCSLLAARCSLFAVRWSLLAVRCSLLAVRCSLFAARCSLFGARCSLLAARCSLFGTLYVSFRLRHALQVRKDFALVIKALADEIFEVACKVMCVVHAHVVGHLQVEVYVNHVA
jgi:hypothetical protein